MQTWNASEFVAWYCKNICIIAWSFCSCHIMLFFFWMCIHVYGQVCTLDLCVSACMRQGMREWIRDHWFLFVRHITSDLFTHVCMMRCGGVGRWKWWKGRVQVHCYAEGRKIVKHIYLTHRQWNLPQILYVSFYLKS